MAKTPEDQREAYINAIRNGNPITGKKDTREAKAIALAFTDESITMEYTVNHLIEQMRYNAAGFVNSLSNLLMDHKDICNENGHKILEAIDENITKEINEIKERLSNGTQL